MQFTAQHKSDILTSINVVSDMISSIETQDSLMEQLNIANSARLQAEQQRDEAQLALTVANDKILRAKTQIEAANAADAISDVARSAALAILIE